MNTEKLNKTIAELREMSIDDIGLWKAKARETRSMLLELAESGGAEECDLEDLRVAMNLNLSRNLMYESTEEWLEKRDELIDAMIEAVTHKRDGILWLRLMIPHLAHSEIRETVKKLGIRYCNQYLFRALETEVAICPTEKKMKWYVAMLDMSDTFEKEAFNRLAYFYLWYGGWACDEEKARNYFLAMDRRGITRKNPYEGTFGESGHEEMIEKLLNGELDEEKFRIYTEWANAQARHMEEQGMTGKVEGDLHEIGGLRGAWIEDPCCRDLGESMHRIMEEIRKNPTEEKLKQMDELLTVFGEALGSMMKKAEEDPDPVRFRKAIPCMLAMLFDHDNWLLRIIELETAGEGEEEYYDNVRKWLDGAEEFCGQDVIIGDELMVLNSLYENLIHYCDEQGNEEELLDLLERHVHSTDGLITLSMMVDVYPIGTEFYGDPYMTHNAMALIRMYGEAGEHAKAEELIRSIDETESRLPDDDEEFRSDQWKTLHNKYLSLVKKPETECGEGKVRRQMSCCGGMIVASQMSDQEYDSLKNTFRPAPPTARGDFIRFLYSQPGDKDWFGKTEEEWMDLAKKMINN